MPFVKQNVTVTNVDHRYWELVDSLMYIGEKNGVEEKHVVPAGYRTDFASVPRVIQWLIPAYGLYTLAAILHDWYCEMLKKWYNRGVAPLISSRDVDGMFRRTMRELGVPVVRRWIMWTGVRWGAMFNRARRKGIAKDLPLMALWSIIAAPVVIPGSLVVGLFLIIDLGVNKVAGLFCK